jgi:hypothetical protein
LDISDNPLGPGTFAPLKKKPTAIIQKEDHRNQHDSWLIALLQADDVNEGSGSGNLTLTEGDSQSQAIRTLTDGDPQSQAIQTLTDEDPQSHAIRTLTDGDPQSEAIRTLTDADPQSRAIRTLTEGDSQSQAIIEEVAVSSSALMEYQAASVVRDIDISKEALDRSECLQYLSCCSLLDLRLNRTNLCVESAISLFKVLGSVDESFTGVSTIARTLKALSLVSNNLYDGPINKTLENVMSNNQTLEILDIGFNNFTSDMLETIRASLLLSDTHLKRRMSPLTVNVTGNKCEPYAVNVPLRHTTLQYGIPSDPPDAYSGGDVDRWTNISASIVDRDKDKETLALLPKIDRNTLKAVAMEGDLSHVPLDRRKDFLQQKVYLKACNRGQGPLPFLSYIS